LIDSRYAVNEVENISPSTCNEISGKEYELFKAKNKVIAKNEGL